MVDDGTDFDFAVDDSDLDFPGELEAEEQKTAQSSDGRFEFSWNVPVSDARGWHVKIVSAGKAVHINGQDIIQIVYEPLDIPEWEEDKYFPENHWLFDKDTGEWKPPKSAAGKNTYWRIKAIAHAVGVKSIKNPKELVGKELRIVTRMRQNEETGKDFIEISRYQSVDTKLKPTKQANGGSKKWA